MQESTEDKRKRLIFRSWHRGTIEIDLLLGKFATAHLPQFSDEQLNTYDRLLQNSDPDIFNWMTKKEPVPAAEQSDVVKMMLEFFK